MHGTAKQEAVCQNENVGKIYKTFITQHSDFSTAKLKNGAKFAQCFFFGEEQILLVSDCMITCNICIMELYSHALVHI